MVAKEILPNETYINTVLFLLVHSLRWATISGCNIGLFTTLALRSWFRSLNPVFVYDEWGLGTLALGLVAAAIRLVSLWGHSYQWQVSPV